MPCFMSSHYAHYSYYCALIFTYYTYQNVLFWDSRLEIVSVL